MKIICQTLQTHLSYHTEHLVCLYFCFCGGKFQTLSYVIESSHLTENELKCVEQCEKILGETFKER